MRPADPDTNQCLLYAIMNVLAKDKEAFAAVTGGNEVEPTRDMVEYLDTRGVDGSNGYNAASITWYLKHLHKEGRIKGFEWQRLNGFEHRALLSDSFQDGALILFGISPATDEKAKTHKKATQVERRLKNAKRLQQEALTVAVAEGERHTASDLTHAVGLRVEGTKRILYDTRNDVVKECTAKDLVCAVEKVCAIHRLRIFL